MTIRRTADRSNRAQDLGTDDLVLSHLTVPRVAFSERVAAAAAAGFAGIGLNIAGWKRLKREGWSIADLAEILDRHDQLLVEIEFLQDWAGPPESAVRAAEGESLAFELADGLGARHLQIGGPVHGPMDDVVEAFAALCDRAAERGLLVALEYLPEMTNIGSSGEALAIVMAADRPNGGICIDAWHHERGPDSLADLGAIDARWIASVQMDDGPVPRIELDYQTDTSTNRLPPGEGGFDLVGLLRMLDAIGVNVPTCLEVISPALAASGSTEDIARRVADGMRSVLAKR